MKKRIRKWKKTLDGNKQKRAFDIQKPYMVRKEAAATSKLVEIEKQVKDIAQGQPTTLLPYYIIFGKEILKKINKSTSQTLINEVLILEQKWEARGLDPILLEQIKNLYIQPYTYIRPFRYDISLLDGDHVLS